MTVSSTEVENTDLEYFYNGDDEFDLGHLENDRRTFSVQLQVNGHGFEKRSSLCYRIGFIGH